MSPGTYIIICVDLNIIAGGYYSNSDYVQVVK